MTHAGRAARAVAEYLATCGDGALDCVEMLAALEREVDRRQHAAVAEARAEHSWSEIGAALGVTKQSAHRRFRDLRRPPTSAHVEQVSRA